jgi:hypothetical protein
LSISFSSFFAPFFFSKGTAVGPHRFVPQIKKDLPLRLKRADLIKICGTTFIGRKSDPLNGMPTHSLSLTPTIRLRYWAKRPFPSLSTDHYAIPISAGSQHFLLSVGAYTDSLPSRRFLLDWLYYKHIQNPLSRIFLNYLERKSQIPFFIS